MGIACCLIPLAGGMEGCSDSFSILCMKSEEWRMLLPRREYKVTRTGTGTFLRDDSILNSASKQLVHISSWSKQEHTIPGRLSTSTRFRSITDHRLSSAVYYSQKTQLKS